jgi:hypothetical protein
MGAPKGNKGEACVEAIRDSLKPGEIVTFSELFARIRSKGTWKDDAIWQHLMLCVVNLPPARRHWKRSKPFLVVHLDGRYELYSPQGHPKVID